MTRKPRHETSCEIQNMPQVLRGHAFLPKSKGLSGRMRSALLVAAVLAAIASCGDSTPGSFGTPCHPDGSCDGGLVCAEGVCVDSGEGDERGTEGNPCHADGGCDGDLVCTDDVCRQPEPVSAYQLTLEADPADGGTLAGEGSYEEGEEVTVSASANPGYLFNRWTNEGILESMDSSFSISMPAAPTTLTAEFIEDTGEVFTVTYVAENGKIRCIERDEVAVQITQQVPSGGSATPVVAIKDSGDVAFVSWSDDAANEFRLDYEIIEDVTFTAFFAPLFTLTVDSEEGGRVVGAEQFFYPVGGKTDATPIKGPARFVEGEAVFLQATPDPGYLFDGWMLDGTLLNDEANFDYTMPGGDIKLLAIFSEAPFELSFTVDPDTTHGIIEGPAQQWVGYGDDAVQVRAIPNANYLFDGWSDGRRHSTRQELHVTRNFDVRARFVEAPTLERAPPALSPSSTDNYVGNDIAIIPNNQPGMSHWLSGVDGVTVNGEALDQHTQWAIEMDLFQPLRIVLHTSQIPEMQQPGDHKIAIFSPAYAPANVTQVLTAGPAAELSIAVQPGGPPFNGELLDPHPVVHVLDSYGNLCEDGPGAETEVSASKDGIGVGNWTLEGTSSLRAVAGVVAFLDLRATNNGMSIITDAQLVFAAVGLENVRSNTFTLPFGIFDSAWLRSDLEDNFAGATLTLPYAANLGNLPNRVTVNGGAPLSFPDQVMFPSNNQGNLLLFTNQIPALQTRGNHVVYLEFSTGISARAMQPITAGPARSMEVVAQPIGPHADPSMDPDTWRPLTRQPVLRLIDAYGNPCFDGPSSGETLTVEATASGDNANWSLDGAPGYFSQGEAMLWLYTNNEIAHDVPNAEITFESAGIFSVASDLFTVPRGYHKPPEIRIYEGQVLAGQPIIVSVVGVTEHWLDSITSIMINGEEVPEPALEYFPEFAKYYITPEDVPGLTQRGSYTLTIDADYYETASVDFDVLANHAHEIKLSTRGGGQRALLLVGPFYWTAPMRQQPIVHIVDEYGNLCADGPSSSGVIVSVHRIVREPINFMARDYTWRMRSSNTSIEAVGGVAEFTDLAPAQFNERMYSRPQRVQMEIRATGLETILSPVFWLTRWMPSVCEHLVDEYINPMASRLVGPDEENNIVGEQIKIEFFGSPSLWLALIKYPSVNGVIIRPGSESYPNYWTHDSSDRSYIAFDTRWIAERFPGAGLHKAGTHEIIIYAYDPMSIDDLQVDDYRWAPRVIQQTMLPAQAESIEIVQGPEDLENSGELMTLEAHLVDGWGNLCSDGPSGDWQVYVSESSDGPVPFVDPRWTLNVVGTSMPGDGTFTFSVRATNDTLSPIYDAEIRFDVGTPGQEGHIVVKTQPFVIPVP